MSKFVNLSRENPDCKVEGFLKRTKSEARRYPERKLVGDSLIIGFGPHAKRIYFPVSLKSSKSYGFRIVAAVDLEEKKKDIENYFTEKNISPIEIIYLNNDERCNAKLSKKIEARLNELVKNNKITGVIISTEPMAHVCYAKWALKNGLSVLMDKPISTEQNVANSPDAAEKLLKDYYSLKNLYISSKLKNKNLNFCLMAQRRFHPAFHKMKSLIREVFLATNCPVTSIQSFHSDGQWRMPNEIVTQDYHPYNQGYGKCSHSGYHTIDIVPWLLEGAQSKDKKPNNVDVFSNFVRPNDFLTQLNLGDYRKLFKDFDYHNTFTENQLRRKYKDFGEIDAFVSLAFKKNIDTLTLASINLVHNGFAQRNWVTTQGKDLYKGNGRVRHESYYIEQGPFQAISVISYQSQELNPETNDEIYDVGGEFHFDIHVFRNDKMFPVWKNYEKISIKDLGIRAMEDKSRGHQEDARREAILEFVSLIKSNKKKNATSDYLDHELATKLMYGIYKSASLRKNNKNSLVNLKI